MIVLNLNRQDMATVIDALDCYQESYRNMLKNAEVGEEFDEIDKMVDYSVSLRDKAKEMDLQELAERCMSYFWDMVEDNDCVPDEFEDLAEDMGIETDELIELFRKAGFD